MKRSALLLILLGSLCLSVQAQHLHRVNNDPAMNADFLTLIEAHEAAADGDTIYLEGSPTFYECDSISKKLYIVGPGYFLDENPRTGANAITAQLNSLTFYEGAAGSVLTGCFQWILDVYIRCDSISLIRNKLNGVIVAAPSTNSLIIQNYMGYILVYYDGPLTSSVIANNIIDTKVQISNTSGNLVISNNVFASTSWRYPSLACFNATVQNNIFCSDSNPYEPSSTGNVLQNNLFAGDGTDANGNKYNMDMTTVFADFDGSLAMSTDGKWMLMDGSPAIGAGVGSIDCGAFAGDTPYVLSGLPALPRIYEASVPALSGSSTMQVNIKVISAE